MVPLRLRSPWRITDGCLEPPALQAQLWRSPRWPLSPPGCRAARSRALTHRHPAARSPPALGPRLENASADSGLNPEMGLCPKPAGTAAVGSAGDRGPRQLSLTGLLSGGRVFAGRALLKLRVTVEGARRRVLFSAVADVFRTKAHSPPDRPWQTCAENILRTCVFLRLVQHLQGLHHRPRPTGRGLVRARASELGAHFHPPSHPSSPHTGQAVVSEQTGGARL